MGNLFWDIRYAVRTLRKNALLTTIIVFSLSLGMGANTAIFSLIDTVLLKMLPVRDPARLVVVTSTAGNGVFSFPVYQELRRQNAVFSDLICVSSDEQFELKTNGGSEQIDGALVSDNYFAGLGVNAVIGRTLTASDYDSVVLSYGFWKRRFDSNPAIIGTSLAFNNAVAVIVGIAPPTFFGENVGRAPDIWAPLALTPQLFPDERSLLSNPSTRWLEVIGRLQTGVSDKMAQTGLEPLYEQIQNEFLSAGKGGNKNPEADRIEVQPGSKGISALRAKFSRPLLILMAMVGIVLFICCMNIANLLLARAATRQREFAVRLSLGASRFQLIRQLLTESILLAMFSGAAALVIAQWASRLLVLYVSGNSRSIPIHVSLDGSVLSFAGLISIATAMIFGLMPALRATRLDIAVALKGIQKPGSQTRLGLARGLVIVEVGLCLLLLTGAGLFIRTLQNLEAFSADFQWDQVLVARLNAPSGNPAAFYELAMNRVRAIPGVRSAAFSSLAFGSGRMTVCCVEVEGYVRPRGEDGSVNINRVGPQFFETMGIPLLRGRDFTERDLQVNPTPIIFNETAVRHYFKQEDALGKRINTDRMSFEIIGVVKDAKSNSLREVVAPIMYIPSIQRPRFIEVRAIGSSSHLGVAIANSLLPDLKVDKIDVLSDLAASTVVQERLIAKLSGFFGIVSTLLACIGLYGIMSYSVSRRTQEIGIRMALGAQRYDVVLMVMRESMLMVGLGTALGVVGVLAVTRFVSSQLFGISSTDPTSIWFTVVLLGSVAAIASYLPARKAAHIEPLTALRYE